MKPCYGCLKPEYGDRVRDSSGQLGYGDIWVVNNNGTAFVQFGSRGPIDIPTSQLEFVSRRHTNGT